MRSALLVAIAAVFLLSMLDHTGVVTQIASKGVVGVAQGDSSLGLDDSEVVRAQKSKLNNIQVLGAAKVTRILPDDLKGSRHQRFILSLSTGTTVLVAHNIDLAARIPDIAIGDIVEFYGEYEWNAKGGVVHWTHHDPGRRHVDGWLLHRGSKYQ